MRERAAFTLIELLIVVAISALLTSLVIVYSGTARNQANLSVQTTTIAQLLVRAKSLAIATYRNPSAPGSHLCGYGVLFDTAAETYSLVSYSPAGGAACPSTAAISMNGITGDTLSQYSADTWHMRLTNGVKFLTTGSQGNALKLALFYPPDPTTLLSWDACTLGDGNCAFGFSSQPGAIYLATTDSSTQQTITVGLVGQIGW